MCLIIFAYKSHPEYPFVLLANRDEFYQRPTQPMKFWDDCPDILAGRDLEQMGTWLGINQAGKFTAVTNYRDGRHPSLNKRSRGELTRDFLSNALTAEEHLDSLAQRKQDYGDFNLLLGDASGLYYCSNRGGETEKLVPGIYGMSNALLNTPWPKLTQAKRVFTEAINSTTLSPEKLIPIMSDREQAADAALPDTGISFEWEKLLSSGFIQGENYGTRATTLLMQKDNGDTYITEQNYDAHGPTSYSEYQLTLHSIGSKAD
ncbi:MAG: hypothetical protein CSA61_00170 [Neptuniibacter caesariensis]|uniref:NRDE family protein n=1 Tax=Neptuniibacter caesariensis TaxID=207954 RepID=A0A2G6JBS8_NEPCE|nr:MAG: hypothetical protein CSA61_00170 [Neptuniibacter caesariensis]